MLHKTIRASAAALILLLLPGLLGCQAAQEETPGIEVAEASCEGFSEAPRLVLFLVADQMRGEYLEHFRPLLRGGLAQLSDESFVFTNVHHNHMPTATATGHATLATGTYPRRHGIIGNQWIDRHENKEIDAIEKGRDPTIEWLEAATLGDWLKDRCPGSKVFAASGKDRAAILPGGRRADAAFWYDDGDGYFKSFPKSWEPNVALAGFFGKNDPEDPEGRRQRADRYFGEVWEALPEVAGEGPSYGIEALDTGLIDLDLPHPLGMASSGPDESFYKAIYWSPFVDSYLAELAKALIEVEELGQDEKPDLLALSFSALDLVGHRYGPDSPEFLDTLLKLDRTLDGLLDFVDEKIGLDHVVISLAGDHGVMSVPEVLSARGFQAKRIDTAEIRCIQRVAATIQEELGSEQPLLLNGFLIDEDAARAAGVSKETVAEMARSALEACNAVARVHLYSELETIEADPMAWDQERLRILEDCRRVARGTPGPELGEAQPPEEIIRWLFANGYHDQRSPDLFPQFEKYVLPYRTSAASHGSPYCYDRWVPWLLRLPDGVGREIAEPAATVDVAPTVAGLLGLKPTAEIDGIDRGPLLVPTPPTD